MYYFVSNQNFNEKIIIPRVPENIASHEDNISKRICVSKSLLGCIISLWSLITTWDEVYVHQCCSSNVITPLKRKVHDGYLTGEEWILEPVKMKLDTILYIRKRIINDQYSEWLFTNDANISFTMCNFDTDRYYKNTYNRYFNNTYNRKEV